MASRKPARKLHAQPLYLEPANAALLDLLSARSRVAKAVLLREAVDDLLKKYAWMQQPALGGLPQPHRVKSQGRKRSK